ncbi:MAG: succinylglutamate desuccinylase/aspartoacylase family protein [Myxococcota bacterium]|nr:succinylglutamate desuccinylase/aspartoacylase family protein [Myxococcota bacterium]
MTALRTLRDPAPGSIAPDVEDFLRALGGPSVVALTGRDRDPARRRAAVTLLHGNEPSGLRAVHALLRAGRRPAGDLLLAVVAVETALGPPPFAHRQRPGGRDLNRCFRAPFEGREGALAGDMLRALEAFAPACLLDLHNNTGQSPPYGVAPRADGPHRTLAGLFGDALVQSDLELGALVEATDRRHPSVTVECGRAGDPQADAVARRGLEAFADAADPAAGDGAGVRVLRDPRRVRVRESLRLAFAARPDPGADLTLRDDLERHNFLPVAAGTALGWVRQGCDWPLEMRDARGRDHSRELFALERGVLRAARELLPIMVTTLPDVARSDCLFYVVVDSGSRTVDPAGRGASPVPRP